ncbi:3-dehydroquinate synthase [Spiractinospora alimapuensis]|uniref:3-dehydroquinate synthase n=1 Tax=Spiractinospora alimapuensis TaxID=2820884 RepID=UPI001EEA08B5|nr:3-dehydroquinate synthase [Spiractinospora alimapuensis]QVQ53147.1 3-dehydroquinate synthase [Spiractinospora alimapuensis]
MSPTRITVGANGTERPYDVVVGRGILGEVAPCVGPTPRRVGVVHPEGLEELARRVRAALADAGHEVLALPVPAGEAAKHVDVASGLWAQLGQAGFTRADVVVGVGGGAVTDLAGFVAATWLRGVDVVHVPTTLLAMVDAAVGGKTGINTAEGKNLVGSFHPPAAVVCDLDVLDSLPRQDYIGGLAEVIKAGFIADPVILDLVERDADVAARPDGAHTRELVERAVTVKAEVVSGDLRESGRREILNYGHTLAHAVEKVEDYRFRHGHAVAIGMVYAAELARRDGRIDQELVDRHRDILRAVGLPTSYDVDSWPALRDAMRVDKKNRGAVRRFVVLDDLARPGTLTDPPEDLLSAAYGDVSA